jgi:hypothetical protein
MRPLHLIIFDLHAELSIERCAKVYGVSEARAYKYAEDAERSGEPIPLGRLLKLIAFAAGLTEPRVQALLDELLGHFVPGNRKIIHKDCLTRIEEDLRALISGGHVEFRPQETLLVCNDCHEPLQVIAGQDGAIRYVCRGCAHVG